MPVTTRLMHRLQDLLGDDATEDLLDCFREAGEMNRAAVREIADLYFARSDARLDQRIAELRQELHTSLAGQRADLLKWMFLFWAGTLVPLAGLMLGLLRR